jgi:hypothetical protein
MGNTARTKGHNYERQIAKEMRELGWPDAATSRYVSQELDDQKVDIARTDPFNIQCKAYKNNPQYTKILSEMPEGANYNIVFHKKPRQGEFVIMKKEDFYELLRAMRVEKILK